jgi:hypothetical protein
LNAPGTVPALNSGGVVNLSLRYQMERLRNDMESFAYRLESFANHLESFAYLLANTVTYRLAIRRKD